MKYFLFPFHFLILSIYDSSASFPGPPYFTSTTQKEKYTVVSGRNETLKCSVKGLEHHTVSWIQAETNAILTMNGNMVTQNPRYAVVTQEPGTFHLFISKVRDEDNGTYICQVNTDPPINKEVSLYVAKPPTFGNTSSSSLSLMSGAPATMFCSAVAEPPPNITWSRADGHTINLQHRGGHPESFGPVLLLGKLTPRDSGDYFCIAKNGYPPSIVKKIRLNVMYGPEVSALKAEVFVTLGQTARLGCSVRGFPTSHITWYKDGLELRDGQGRYKVDIVESGKKKNEVRTFLEVQDTSHLDWGVYTCQAHNDIGNNEAAVVLKEFVQRVEKNERKKLKSSSRGKGRKTSVKNIFVTESSSNIRRNYEKNNDNHQKMETVDYNDDYNKYSFFSSGSSVSSLLPLLISVINFCIILLV